MKKPKMTAHGTANVQESIEKVRRYADWVIANKIKTIYVYPLEKKRRNSAEYEILKAFFNRLGFRGDVETIKCKAVSVGYRIVEWTPDCVE